MVSNKTSFAPKSVEAPESQGHCSNELPIPSSLKGCMGPGTVLDPCPSPAPLRPTGWTLPSLLLLQESWTEPSPWHYSVLTGDSGWEVSDIFQSRSWDDSAETLGYIYFQPLQLALGRLLLNNEPHSSWNDDSSPVSATQWGLSTAAWGSWRWSQDPLSLMPKRHPPPLPTWMCLRA